MSRELQSPGNSPYSSPRNYSIPSIKGDSNGPAGPYSVLPHIGSYVNDETLNQHKEKKQTAPGLNDSKKPIDLTVINQVRNKRNTVVARPNVLDNVVKRDETLGENHDESSDLYETYDETDTTKDRFYNTFIKSFAENLKSSGSMLGGGSLHHVDNPQEFEKLLKDSISEILVVLKSDNNADITKFPLINAFKGTLTKFDIPQEKTAELTNAFTEFLKSLAGNEQKSRDIIGELKRFIITTVMSKPEPNINPKILKFWNDVQTVYDGDLTKQFAQEPINTKSEIIEFITESKNADTVDSNSSGGAVSEPPGIKLKHAIETVLTPLLVNTVNNTDIESFIQGLSSISDEGIYTKIEEILKRNIPNFSNDDSGDNGDENGENDKNYKNTANLIEKILETILSLDLEPGQYTIQIEFNIAKFIKEGDARTNTIVIENLLLTTNSGTYGQETDPNLTITLTKDEQSYSKKIINKVVEAKDDIIKPIDNKDLNTYIDNYYNTTNSFEYTISDTPLLTGIENKLKFKMVLEITIDGEGTIPAINLTLYPLETIENNQGEGSGSLSLTNPKNIKISQENIDIKIYGNKQRNNEIKDAFLQILDKELKTQGGKRFRRYRRSLKRKSKTQKKRANLSKTKRYRSRKQNKKVQQKSKKNKYSNKK